jgi:hypothetical protein
MRVFVTDPAGNEAHMTVGSGGNVGAVKRVIHERSGVPVEYQNLSHVDSQILDDAVVLDDIALGGDEIRLRLFYVMKGGGAGVKIDDFECKFRCMCCYSGLDSHIDKCQWFCVKCECTIM